ncbi:MAG: hypothetical protein K2L45_03950 [Muribaculaceae bacterium]|nr:hypothetical protein [Muribaculaceae bacterium]
MKRLGLMAVCLMLLFSCGCDRHHKQLERIDTLCESSPRQAVFALDSIDYGNLSEKERHYYDLLYVKSRDKAYARHSSDSLILDAISYYSKTDDKKRYAQSLFYAGRVYSHLGDLPSAIEYYSKAADELSHLTDDEECLKLRTEALSITGRLHAELKRNQEAIPYIKKAIYDLKYQNDSTGIVYDNLQLVKIFTEESDFEQAKHHLSEAIRYSDHIPEEGKAWIRSEKASILIHEGKEDSAMIVMKPLARLVDSLYNNYAYRPTGKFFKDGSDAGYIYAKELSFSRDFNNQLVVTELRHPLIPKDSVHSFVMAYESRVDENMNRYESEEEMMQKTKFNYDTHLKARRKAEAEKRQLIFAACILLLIACGIAVYFKIRSLKNELRLRTALNIIDRIGFVAELENAVESVEVPLSRIEYLRSLKALPMDHSDKPSLKEELLDRLMAFSSEEMPKAEVEEEILKSTVMETLQKMLEEGKGIAQTNEDIWQDIEKTVEAVSPDFRAKLEVLASGKVTKSEYQVALLAKFGITPKKIASLLFRSKSAITDRRSSLAKKIFGPKADTSALDRLIARL